VELSAAPGVEL
jgi:hypothetical protein